MATKATDSNALAIPGKADETPKKKPGKRKKLLLVFLLLLILGAGGGGGAYWWFFMRQTDTPDNEQAATGAETPATSTEANVTRVERVSSLPRSSGMVLPLPQFVVSISEAGVKRYLKVGLELEATRDISQELKEREGKIHDAVLVLLASRSFAELQSRAGRTNFKTEVGELINRMLETPLVGRVFFTEFIVE